MAKIMIVDDEKSMRRLLHDLLSNKGHAIVEAENGEVAIEKLIEERHVDLILLDIRMPSLTGTEAISALKDISDAPIIFLTALDDVNDEIMGLGLGADDYITKPFNQQVLLARIQSTLRRNSKNKPETFLYKSLTLDFTNSIAYIMEGSKKRLITFTQREFEMLDYMIHNENITLNRTKLLDRLWGYDFYGDPRTVDTHVKTIRSKLGEYGGLIKTVRGVGYRFEKN